LPPALGFVGLLQHNDVSNECADSTYHENRDNM